ncbi:hypothetical protein EV383_2278 [Pseudonocardia sediminis]|uniref:Streptogramin lyase n=2 Tax=Pseudonocardia sediminis TaxID=1397368 RepID=A0A4Q7UYT1_PSEST|nr:hypothetical protein EV383_2278 [Pseudonocardia sediminis]
MRGFAVLATVLVLAVVTLVVVLGVGLDGLIRTVAAGPPEDPSPTTQPAAPSPAPASPGAVSPGTASPSTAAPLPAGAVRVGPGPVDVEGDATTLWTADRAGASVTRVLPGIGATITFPVGGEPAQLVVADGRVWVWNYSSAITPVDVRTGRAGDLVRTELGISAIAAGDGGVWFTVPSRGLLGRIDTRTGRFDPQTVPLGGRPDHLAYDAGRLTVLDSAAHTVRTVDTRTRAVGAPRPVPAEVTTVAAGSGRRYVVSETALAPLGDGPVRDDQLVRVGPIAAYATAPTGVWVLDTAGALRRWPADLRDPAVPIRGQATGGDVLALPDGRVWVLDTAAATLRPAATR